MTLARSSFCGQPAHHLDEGAALAAGVLVQADEVGLGDPVDLGGGQVEEGDRVFGAREHAEEVHEKADLLARVESAAAAEAMRDALDVEGAQEGIGVAVAAHQHRDIARAEAGLDPLGHERGHAVGLGGHRVEVQVAHRHAPGPLRAQALVDAREGPQPVRVVVGDETGRGVEDGLGGAMVLHQHHLASARVEVAEGEKVGGRGPAPAVDGLVVVAHHREVGGVSGHEPQQLELGLVGVLELVDEHVTVARAEPGQHRGAAPQEVEGPVDLVAEVHEAGLGQEPLLRLVEGRELELLVGLVLGFVGLRRRPCGFGMGAVLLGRHVFVLGPARVADEGVEVTGRITEGPEATQGKIEDALAEEHDLLGLAQHPEIGMEAEVECALAQDAVAEGVKGGDPGLGVAVGDQLVHPLRHLHRSLLGEGEGEDLLGPRHLARDEVGDAPGEHGGLAGAGPRDDEQGPLAVEHGLALGFGEALEDAVFAGGGRKGS